jgi:hypothetical protein
MNFSENFCIKSNLITGALGKIFLSLRAIAQSHVYCSANRREPSVINPSNPDALAAQEMDPENLKPAL